MLLSRRCSSVDEPGLLPGVLEVVAGIGLVGNDADQRRRPDRQVNVQVDPRLEVAVVPVVAGPGLTADQPEPQPFTGRQAELDPRALAKDADQPIGHGRQPVDRDNQSVVPFGQALDEWLGARQEPIDLGPGRCEQLERAAFDRPVEAAFDVFEVGRPGQPVGSIPEGPGIRLDCPQLGTEPSPPGRFLDLGRDPCAEGGGIVDQAIERRHGCHVNLGLERGRTEVSVDEPRPDLVQAKGEGEVAGGDRIRGRHGPLATGGRLGQPGVSPTKGMFRRSAASRLIRRAAVFWPATSRT